MRFVCSPQVNGKALADMVEALLGLAFDTGGLQARAALFLRLLSNLIFTRPCCAFYDGSFHCAASPATPATFRAPADHTLPGARLSQRPPRSYSE